MTTTSHFTPKIRKGLLHLLVLLISVQIISFYFPLSQIDGIHLWQPLAQLLVLITAFYAHSFLLLPILIEQRNNQKYFSILGAGLLLLGAMSLWIEALHSVAITQFADGTKPGVVDFLFQKNLILHTLLAFLFLLLFYIPLSGISFLYYMFMINRKERKALLSSKNMELYINLLILAPLFLIFLLNTETLNGRMELFLELLLFTSFFYLCAFYISPQILTNKNRGKSLVLLMSSFLLIIAGTAIIYGKNFLLLNLGDLGILLFLTLLLSLTYGYVRFKVKRDEQIFHLKLGAKETELKLLKSQVNPHFLFNNLNTLYSLALEENAPKTAESTAKMANLIRYMQNEINKDFIPLENEIQYLKDFIAIQKVRCEVPPHIETNFINISNQKISPGILIPFVENAFKHGIDPSGPSTLYVSVICKYDSIFFKCVNSYNDKLEAFYKEQGFGIGIKNTRDRLKLVYSKNHKLEIIKTEKVFTVELEITTQ